MTEKSEQFFKVVLVTVDVLKVGTIAYVVPDDKFPAVKLSKPNPVITEPSVLTFNFWMTPVSEVKLAVPFFKPYHSDSNPSEQRKLRALINVLFWDVPEILVMDSFLGHEKMAI